MAVAGFVILGVGAVGLALGLREYAGARRAAQAGGGPGGGAPVGGAPVGGAIAGATVAGATGSLS